MGQTNSHSPAYYLQQALLLAQQRRGFCAPNPAVGAVVVKENRILATGLHWAAGSPHAEVAALEQLSSAETKGATIYITLEPCSHYGRTPPCTELLIKKGVKTVYYAFKDPNPQVAATLPLQHAGISSHHYPLPEIDAFYQSYAYWTQTKRPWVTIKLALTLDGKIATDTGQRLAITGPALQEYTQQWRKKSDAILTTAKTIIGDDPQLNVRLAEQTINKPLYIIDTHLALPLTAQIIQTAAHITVFHQPHVGKAQRQKLEQHGVRCVCLPLECGKLSLNQALQSIGEDGVHDLWVEAGGTIFQAFINQQLAQRAFIYVAPKWQGEQGQLACNGHLNLGQYTHLQWLVIGQDVACELTF